VTCVERPGPSEGIRVTGKLEGLRVGLGQARQPASGDKARGRGRPRKVPKLAAQVASDDAADVDSTKSDSDEYAELFDADDFTEEMLQ
jgi:hypothetical protein